ncbi:tetratricopeptide repeat protein [Pseudodesulfovibrio sp.]|uniref:tetratricopeptide repeat protein n=1 Tax=Pseudodesulfovibrio sp. TaxID=2035812 RepID=UPI0026225CC4|nr:tetratricopeptide repeat protein [Pseudodesulfovibrio sp.]MDD3311774.1 tetratricopeptide repeat protein [Pseudodesulfovibrio sp.]
MLYDYLVLGNCQSSRIATRLTGRHSVKNYILSYPGFFPNAGIDIQRECLIEAFGETLYRIYMKSGIVLPIPSLGDLIKHDYKNIVITIPHKRVIHKIGDAYLGSNFNVSKLGIECDQYEPPMGYVDSYVNLIDQLKSAYPSSRLTVVVRASGKWFQDGLCTCWFDDWADHVEEFNRKVLNNSRFDGLRFVFLDDFIPACPGRDSESYETIYVDGRKVVDVEHLPGAIWDDVVKEIVSSRPAAGREVAREPYDKFIPLKDFTEFKATCTLARLLVNSGMAEEAFRVYEIATRCSSFRVIDLAGATCGILQYYNWDACCEALRDVIGKVGEGDADFLFERIYSFLIDANRFEEAEAVFLRAKARSFSLLQSRGVYFRKNGQYDEALEAFNKAENVARDVDSRNTAIQEQSVTLFENARFDASLRNLERITPKTSLLDGHAVVWVGGDAADVRDCLLIGTAPTLLTGFLVDRLMGLGGRVSLLGSSRTPDSIREKVDFFAPLPGGKIERGMALDASLSALRGKAFTATVIATSGIKVELYANVHDFAAMFKAESIYYYSMSQLLHRYRLDHFFRRRALC